jgi:hypothetical protein
MYVPVITHASCWEFFRALYQACGPCCWADEDKGISNKGVLTLNESPTACLLVRLCQPAILQLVKLLLKALYVGINLQHHSDSPIVTLC